MREKEILVANEIGLVSRAAANFVERCKQYDSDIYIEKGNRIYNGKSIMSVLSMSCTGGSAIKVKCDGKDEDKAIKALDAYLTEEIKHY